MQSAYSTALSSRLSGIEFKKKNKFQKQTGIRFNVCFTTYLKLVYKLFDRTYVPSEGEIRLVWFGFIAYQQFLFI